MARIAEKGTDAENWLTKEQGRFVLLFTCVSPRSASAHVVLPSFPCRLTKLISSPSLAPTKKDEVKIKLNVLSSFLSKKVAQAVGGAQEVYEAVKEEVEDAWGGVKQEL